MIHRDSQINELKQQLEPIAERLRAFVEAVEPIAEGLQHLMRAVAPIALEVARTFSHLDDSEVLSKTGWVPHYTMPFRYVAESGKDIEAIRSKVLNYYTNNWQKVRSEIQLKLSDYKIDGEAKATFCEALDAHEAGLYRCVCRVLFPEIERLLRTEILESNIHRSSYKDMIKGLVDGDSELAHDKSLGDFTPNGIYQLVLFEYLTKALREKNEHATTKSIYGLYTNVRTPESLEIVKQDPVPNRHAAMHGLVVYSTPQNSLNMIFVADYIFQIIGSFKESLST